MAIIIPKISPSCEKLCKKKNLKAFEVTDFYNFGERLNQSNFLREREVGIYTQFSTRLHWCWWQTVTNSVFDLIFVLVSHLGSKFQSLKLSDANAKKIMNHNLWCCFLPNPNVVTNVFPLQHPYQHCESHIQCTFLFPIWSSEVHSDPSFGVGRGKFSSLSKRSDIFINLYQHGCYTGYYSSILRPFNRTKGLLYKDRFWLWKKNLDRWKCFWNRWFRQKMGYKVWPGLVILVDRMGEKISTRIRYFRKRLTFCLWISDRFRLQSKTYKNATHYEVYCIIQNDPKLLWPR